MITAEGLCKSRWAHFALFLVVIFALRVASFGDLSRHADETFYFLVGQRMHAGVLPYVDVWDRKPFGLFAIYWAIAGISTSVLCYQIITCALGAVTAWLIHAIVRPWSSERGALLAGLGYLVMTGPFEGATGQTPDFYNPLIAGAALLLLGERERLARQEVGARVWLAMALCGLALTIKQTTVFEGVFLGLYLLHALVRAGTPPARIAGVAVRCMIIAALPMLAIAAAYFANGHWAEYWHAMVGSNFAKQQEGGAAFRALSIALYAAPLLFLAALGLGTRAIDPQVRLFVGTWLAAALVGFVSVPNFYGHYLLPVLVPLCVASGFAWGRIGWWALMSAVTVVWALIWYNPFDRALTIESNRAMRAMTALIRAHDHGGGLLVFDGPVYLYATANERFLSPLVFPQHFNHAIETDVSHLRTAPELARLLAARPGVIVMSRMPRSLPVNWASRRAVLAYARANCRIVGIEKLAKKPFPDEFVVFGDCDPGKRQNHP